MRASHDIYQKVAENCSEFAPIESEYIITSSTKERDITTSCENCYHFDSDKYCRLDIYDKIVGKFDHSKFS